MNLGLYEKYWFYKNFPETSKKALETLYFQSKTSKKSIVINKKFALEILLENYKWLKELDLNNKFNKIYENSEQAKKDFLYATLIIFATTSELTKDTANWVWEFTWATYIVNWQKTLLKLYLWRIDWVEAKAQLEKDLLAIWTILNPVSKFKKIEKIWEGISKGKKVEKWKIPPKWLKAWKWNQWASWKKGDKVKTPDNYKNEFHSWKVNWAQNEWNVMIDNKTGDIWSKSNTHHTWDMWKRWPKWTKDFSPSASKKSWVRRSIKADGTISGN